MAAAVRRLPRLSSFLSRVHIVAFLLLCAAGCLGPSAVRDRVEEDVLAADRARIASMVSADAQRLDLVLHESLTYTHSNGLVEGKVSLIETLVSEKVDYRLVEPLAPHLRVHRDTAIVTSPVQMEVALDGRVHHLRNIYTAVYWWAEGRWQLVAYQSSSVSSPQLFEGNKKL